MSNAPINSNLTEIQELKNGESGTVKSVSDAKDSLSINKFNDSPLRNSKNFQNSKIYRDYNSTNKDPKINIIRASTDKNNSDSLNSNSNISFDKNNNQAREFIVKITEKLL